MYQGGDYDQEFGTDKVKPMAITNPYAPGS